MVQENGRLSDNQTLLRPAALAKAFTIKISIIATVEVHEHCEEDLNSEAHSESIGPFAVRTVRALPCRYAIIALRSTESDSHSVETSLVRLRI